MRDAKALKLAIDLLHFPGYVESLRSAPLPDDVFDVIRIAAGEQLATEKAAEATFRSCQQVREAAEFYVEQVLLYPEADCYRVLGAKADATHQELRRNMAVLLRWLHPDRDGQGARAVFASRVTDAWDRVKTEERRAAYDRVNPQKVNGAIPNEGMKSQKQKSSVQRQGAWSLERSRRRHVYAKDDDNLLRRMLMRVFGRPSF